MIDSAEVMGLIKKLQEDEKYLTGVESYYHVSALPEVYGVTLPAQMKKVCSAVGVARVYVDAMATRVRMEGVTLPDGMADSQDRLWHAMVKAGVLRAQRELTRDVLVFGRGYLLVDEVAQPGWRGGGKKPRVSVVSPLSTITSLDGALAIRRLRVGKETEFHVYTDTHRAVVILGSDRKSLVFGDVEEHGFPFNPVVAFGVNTSARYPRGQSIITPDVQSVTDDIARIVSDMLLGAAEQALPQRIITGTTVKELTNGGQRSAMEVYKAAMLAVKDADARAISLPGANLQNYTVVLSALLKLAGAYTGLPPQWIAASSDNPTSADAMRSSEVRLIDLAESYGDYMQPGWDEVVARVAFILGDQAAVELGGVEMRDPATPSLAAKADAAVKLQSIVPTKQLRVDLGYSPSQIQQMEEWDSAEQAGSLGGLYEGLDR